MYAQFLARYPTGSLVTELLQIHEHQYVVRAVVQVSGTTLATGMAAASSIEQAEDQARARALVVLGIYLPSYESQAHLDESPAPPARLSPATSPALEDRTWMLTSPEPIDSSEVEDYAHPSQTYRQPDLLSSASPPEPEVNGRSAPRDQAQPELAKGRRNGRVAPAPPPSAPIDLSDIIAQTSVELKRLGWNEVQGRTHLMATYGKRSRQQLTDEELLEFLDYLKSQPSEIEPSF